MKLTILILLSLLSTHALAADKTFTASLAKPDIWNGAHVPTGQQCQKFGGKGTTPSFKIQNIPRGANAIITEYSDATYQPMNNGGHGKIGYRIEKNISSITLPTLKGHTFDLPKGFFLIEAQRAPKWDKAGAYLPPCSGGKGNEYYVLIKAVKETGGEVQTIFSSIKIGLGKY